MSPGKSKTYLENKGPYARVLVLRHFFLIIYNLETGLHEAVSNNIHICAANMLERTQNDVVPTSDLVWRRKFTLKKNL